MVLHSFKIPTRPIPLDFTVPGSSSGQALKSHLEGQYNLRFSIPPNPTQQTKNPNNVKTNTFLVFAAAFAAAIHSTNAQLIINGGFETPDTPTYTYIYPGQNTLAPWVVGAPYAEVGDAVGNGYITGAAFDSRNR